MNLLIVDDEQLTRDGLIRSIQWTTLGIHNIYQADDGIHGLDLARKYHPEIILSDVRMPRMDGIEMSYQIKTFLPDCNIIFMSGYSDKEYLKAAIKLKAISYVEKPIDLEEIKEAVSEAVQNHTAALQTKETESLHLLNHKEKLALKLCHQLSVEQESQSLRLLQTLGYPIKSNTFFTTLILKLYTPLSKLSDSTLFSFENRLKVLAPTYHLQSISANKQDEYFILHLFARERTPLSVLKQVAATLISAVSVSSSYDMIFGKTVNGLGKLSDSYNSAVILLQSAFFIGPNSVLFEEEHQTSNRVAQIPDTIAPFCEALREHLKENAYLLVEENYSFFKKNSFLLPNQAKDVYYKLFNSVREAAKSKHLIFGEEEQVTNLDYISNCSHLCDLQLLLRERVRIFFENLEKDNPDNSVIYLIKQFVANNYTNMGLSVKDISEHVLLSSSYVCTIFKMETGQTLNQYLTEYRLDKAKRFLEDSRYKITDISAKVGYSDGNYFGKTFKKAVGLSPSEYRERFEKNTLSTT